MVKFRPSTAWEWSIFSAATSLSLPLSQPRRGLDLSFWISSLWDLCGQCTHRKVLSASWFWILHIFACWYPASFYYWSKLLKKKPLQFGEDDQSFWFLWKPESSLLMIILRPQLTELEAVSSVEDWLVHNLELLCPVAPLALAVHRAEPPARGRGDHGVVLVVISSSEF